MFLFHTEMKILNNSRLVSVVHTQRWMFYLEYHKPSNSYLNQFCFETSLYVIYSIFICSTLITSRDQNKGYMNNMKLEVIKFVLCFQF